MRLRLLLILLPAVLAAMGLQSCKSRRDLSATKLNLKRVNTRQLVEAVHLQDARYPYLVFKGNLRFQGRMQRLRANYTMHLEQGERLWGAFSLMGIEGARFLITRDSFFYYNRLEKVYMAESFGKLNRQTGLVMDFQLLEDLLLGNLPHLDIPMQLARNSEHNAPDILMDYKTVDLLVRLDAKLLRPLLLRAEQPLLSVDSEIRYGEHKAVDSLAIPHEVDFVARSPRSLRVNLNHRQVRAQLDSPPFPFRIPSGYTRQEL